VDLIVVDDSAQRRPKRKGMGHLVAVGGIHVPGEEVLSRHSRLMQLADLITSCTLSYVGGQVEHHTTLFKEKVAPQLRSMGGRIWGYGLKIQPDFRYGNLYHWLLGDESLGHIDLPTRNRAYAGSPDEP
jgi:hypothetical protein